MKYDRFGRIRVRSLRSVHGLLRTRIDLGPGEMAEGKEIDKRRDGRKSDNLLPPRIRVHIVVLLRNYRYGISDDRDYPRRVVRTKRMRRKGFAEIKKHTHISAFVTALTQTQYKIKYYTRQEKL